jgi:hypothetical protein
MLQYVQKLHLQKTLNYLCANHLQCGLAEKCTFCLFNFFHYVDIVVQYYLQSELWVFNICALLYIYNIQCFINKCWPPCPLVKTLQHHSSLTACGYIHSHCNRIVPDDVYKVSACSFKNKTNWDKLVDMNSAV